MSFPRVCSFRHLRLSTFTLIELLVVVSIIAVLAAMLLPALSQARMIAQKTSCMNTQKQLTTALRMYADDMTDQGFPWVHEVQTQQVKYAWAQSMETLKYIKDDAQLFCTAQPDTMYYGNVATWDPNSGMGVPNAQRKMPIMQYGARARGMRRLGDTGGINTVVTWGQAAPVQVNAAVENVNITQNDANWQKMPSDYTEFLAPILSCPNVGRNPASGVQPGSYSFPQGSWSVRMPHLANTVMNYGNTDGSVFSVTFPGGDQGTLMTGVIKPMWRGIWPTR